MRRRRFIRASTLPTLIGVAGCAALAAAHLQGVEEDGIVLSFSDERVIRYSSDEGLADPIAMLGKQISAGKVRLAYDKQKGYLPALLKALKVPVSSQTLVFSKTSSQSPFVGPKTPRALYFNDEVFVAWAQGSSVIDLAAIDPNRGPIFYTMSQSKDKVPKAVRDHQCMSCHIGPKTLDVPGLVVRSVYSAPTGMPVGMVDGFVSGHNNPLKERWGGWYVTGTHGNDTHMGNLTLSEQDAPTADLKPSSNITSLEGMFDTSKYLSPHSDSVALLVLDHTVRMHVYLTRARYETLLALDENSRAPDNPKILEWSKKRIEAAGEALVAYMLFRDEAQLDGPITGTSGYDKEFPKLGPRDSKGRSLRDFDLVKRVFKYPCSYLVYSPPFEALPPEMKEFVWKRLNQVLTGAERGGLYATMSDADRQAVLEILVDTKPEFKAWREKNALARASRTSLGPQ